MYRIFIDKKDKQKAVDIICDGIDEYISDGINKYLNEHGCSRISDKIDTSELHVDSSKIVFITEIANEDELLELQIDGRSKRKKIAIYWDAEYYTADDIISDI